MKAKICGNRTHDLLHIIGKSFIGSVWVHKLYLFQIYRLSDHNITLYKGLTVYMSDTYVCLREYCLHVDHSLAHDRHDACTWGIHMWYVCHQHIEITVIWPLDCGYDIYMYNVPSKWSHLSVVLRSGMTYYLCSYSA